MRKYEEFQKNSAAGELDRSNHEDSRQFFKLFNHLQNNKVDGGEMKMRWTRSLRATAASPVLYHRRFLLVDEMKRCADLHFSKGCTVKLFLQKTLHPLKTTGKDHGIIQHIEILALLFVRVVLLGMDRAAVFHISGILFGNPYFFPCNLFHPDAL